MKKLLMAVAAFGMLLTSCAKDDTVAPIEDKEALVSFCVNSPAVATRYGEGETAQDLYYAVYDTQEGYVAGLSKVDGSVEIKTSTTVNLNLVQGRSYEVIFWAQAEAEDAPYTLAWGNTAAEAKMTYKPQATLTANNEKYDAFYAHVESFEVKGAVSQTVELKRPFAQLNVATADTALASTAGVDIATTGVKVSGVYTSLNLANDTVDGETTLTFAPTTKANGKISANGKEYDHIAMNYLLVNDKKLVDVTLTLSEDNGNAATDLTRNYTSVPVQRNYRTNIIGNILTSTADFNVEIKPGFTDDIPATLIEAAEETGTITVNSAEGLLSLSKLNADWAALFSNGQGTAYSNYAEVNGGKGVAFYYKWTWTIKLGADIDLKGATIDPINIAHWGTFDGQGHTIKNATIETATNVETEAGLFITDQYNSFKNVVLDNIHVKGSLVGNSTAGILAGSCHAGVDKITISNSSVWGGKYTGGVVGYGYTSVTNCTLTNCVVKGGYKLGGVIGYICSSSDPKAVEGNNLTNCTVAGTDGQYAGGKDKYIMGRIVGNFNCDGTCKNNTVVSMTTNATTDIGEIEAGKNVNSTATTVTVTESNTEVEVSTETVTVTVPADAAQAGDNYQIVVSNESTVTDTTTGETTVAFDLTMYKNDVKVSGDVIYEVTKNVGAGKIISGVKHNGTALAKATTGADQTYTYDSVTGVLTIYTKSFGPFAITYADYKDYVRKLNRAHNVNSTISISTGADLLPIVAVNPEIYGYSVFDGDTRITDKVIFRFSDVKKVTIDENSYKVSVNLAILDDKGTDLEIKDGRMNQYNPSDPREHLHVYMNLIEVPAGYSISTVKVNDSTFTLTNNASGNPATGEYWIGSDAKDIYFQSKTAGLIEVTLTK